MEEEDEEDEKESFDKGGSEARVRSIGKMAKKKNRN